MFTTLQRYIFKQYIAVLSAIMIVLVGFFILVRFTEEVNHFVTIADTTPFMEFVKYFLYEIPYTFTYLFPLGVMFATVFTLGRLNSNRELYILFTTGKGMFHHLKPVCLVLTVICVVFSIFEDELFYVLHRKHRVLARELRNQTFYQTSERVNFVQFGSDNKVYMIKGFDPVSGSLRGINLIYLTSENKFKSLVSSERGNYLSEGEWEFFKTYIRDFTGSTVKYQYDQKKRLHLNEDPYHFDRVYIKIEDLSAREVKRLARKLERIGGNSKKSWTDYHFKVANYYSALIMFFFAIPLSIFSRNAVLALSFFFVLMTAFVYIVFANVGFLLGHIGILPPYFAGWFGNIVFFIVSAIFYYKFRK
ncbi:hypothetical protein COTS27_01633 [Spirochaetota bacterium]|nr:hypothetical protein COTS27_01633 [Spirochaetota bacterium]